MKPADIKGGWYLDSYEMIDDFRSWLIDTLQSGQPISIDTETRSATELWTPLPTGYGFVRLWQVGTATEGWAIPAREWWGVIEWAMEQIARATCIVAYANCKYDQHACENEGWAIVPWHRVRDVVIMHRLIHPEERQHGLKPSAELAFGEWAGMGQRALADVKAANGWGWGEVPTHIPEYWQYGIVDTILTVGLYLHLAPNEPAWSAIEHDYTRITYEMEKRGVLVDPIRIRETDDVWTAELEQVTAQLRALDIENPGSNKQIEQALRSYGFEPSELTETGAARLDKLVLATLAEAGEPIASTAKLLMRYRRLDKWRSVYARKLLDAMNPDTLLLHPQINTMQATTGRSSITNPPLQTIPKKAITRNMFKARKGRKLWAIDYDSQEARVFAALAEDPGMVAVFAEGDGDIHTLVAGMAGVSRDAAKTVFYAKLYGAGAAKIGQSLGTDASGAQAVVNRIDASFPAQAAWIRGIIDMAEARAREGYPWIEVPVSGRRLTCDPGAEYRLVNYAIQGAGADVLKRAAVRLSRAGYDDFMVLPVHDELLFEFPEGPEGAAMAHEAAEIMGDHNFSVPLTASPEGPFNRWGQKHEEKS